MLESGEFTIIAELADGKGVAPSFLTRLLRPTLLTQDIVEAIVNFRQVPEVTLARLQEPLPPVWDEQQKHID